MKIELEMEELQHIGNLMKSRINDLREQAADDEDREEEIREVIRQYKKILQKIENQIQNQ